LASEVRFNRSHAEHIMSYLGNCKLIVGHNVKFDIDRLSEQFIRVGAVD
jgi:DNA polymerase III epsilon subunit-like protein